MPSVRDAQCGVLTTLSSSKKRESVGGSDRRTSRPVQRIFIGQPAAGGIDEECFRFHQLDFGRIHHPLRLRLRRQRQVQRDKIALLQQHIKRYWLDTVCLDESLLRVRFVGQDFHVEVAGALRHFPSDVAQSDNADGFSPYVYAAGRLPYTIADAPVLDGNVVSEGEEQTEGMIGEPPSGWSRS